MKLANLFEKAASHSENDDMGKTPAPGKLGDYITSAQAARELGVTMSRIRQFVMEKRLKSYRPEKGRRDHMFKLSDIKRFAKEDREITGRPPEGNKSDKD